MVSMVHASTAPRKAGFWQGLILLLPCSMAVMGVLVLAPVLPNLMVEFKDVPGARFWVPTMLTTPALCLVFLSPLAGALGDKFGRRRLLIVSTFVYAGFGVWPIFLHDLRLIVLTRVGVGACEAMVLTLSTALIGDTFQGRRRDRWLAAQTGVASIAAILCLMAGGVLGSVYGWRGPFALYGLVIFLAVAVWRVTWEPGAGAAADVASDVAPLDFPWKRLAGICLVSLVGSILFYTVQIQMSVALNVLGLKNPALIGGLTALASLGVPVGTVLFPLMAQKPIGWLLGLEFLIIGGSFICMSLFRTPAPFVAAATINLVGAGMLFPTLLTWALRQFRFEYRGLGTGIWQGVFSAGQFCSGILMAQLAVSLGDVVRAFAVMGVLALISSVLAVVIGSVLTRRFLSIQNG